MIDYIDKHFNPSFTVDSLGYIFDLIDIKQGQDKPVVTLRAQFSRVFASLKMGGVDIASSLQVGFMLRALLSWCGASLGGTLDYIPNPTLKLKKRRVFTFDALIAS